MQCNPDNPRCSGSPIVQSGWDKLETIPPLTWCLGINVANPEYLSWDICISICCWAQDFIIKPSSLYISVLEGIQVIRLLPWPIILYWHHPSNSNTENNLHCVRSGWAGLNPHHQFHEKDPVLLNLYPLFHCSGETRHWMGAAAGRREATRGTWGRACPSAGPRSGTRSSLLRTVSEKKNIFKHVIFLFLFLQRISQEGDKPFLLSW